MEKKLEYNLDPFYKYKGRIIRVVDADTMDVYLDMGFNMFTNQRLRIDDYDAPETWRPRNEAEKEHGLAATIRAKELLEGFELIFTTSKAVGIYGRFGASITLSDGRKFGEVMINEGFAKKETY
jgi:endonuclease YncB( thermonuclease family)